MGQEAGKLGCCFSSSTDEQLQAEVDRMRPVYSREVSFTKRNESQISIIEKNFNEDMLISSENRIESLRSLEQ